MEEKAQKKKPKTVTTASTILENGELLETIYRPSRGTTAFVKGMGDEWTYESSARDASGETLVPPSPHNSLVKHGIVLFPSQPAEYGSEEELIATIEAYLRRYVDLSATFEKIAARYILLTWVYDAFNEVPYLRFHGDYGSGKTRALLTVGSICYKAVFASGASSISPIFHILDIYGGTLLLDEADFRVSDEKADLVKVLNNGNVKGLPVLRTMPSPDGREFNPRAFKVFGPKLVASRGSFEDRALESRFVTEEMGRHGLRADVPLNLPEEQKDEASAIRNMLLLYRLRNRHMVFIDESLADPSLEPRFNQILIPLLSVTEDRNLQRAIQGYVREMQNALILERGETIEGRVVELLADRIATTEEMSCPIGDLVARFSETYGAEFDRTMTPKWMGFLLRKRLGLRTFRRGGVFFVSLAERDKLRVLFRRHGLAEDAATVPGD